MTTDVDDISITGALERLRTALSTMTPAERAAAEWVLRHPGEAAHSSAARVAQAAGVGFGSVIRAAQRAGFREFNELRTGLAIDLLAPQGQRVRLRQLTPHASPYDVLAYVLTAAAQTLTDTLSTVSPEAFAKAVEVIAQAHTVLVLGAGSISGALAHMLQVRLLGSGIRAWASSQSNDHVSSALLLEAGDAVIGISQSGDTKSIVEALQVARQHEIPTIGITGYPHSALAQVSTHVLTCAVTQDLSGEPSFSRVPMVAIFDALAITVLFYRSVKCERKGARCHDRHRCIGSPVGG
ncbi:MAG: MurR/RpiR family transcriptional regulator [Chloroflexi bacterium]|nr:MurR/RpiR family transcriptional regulator [Chloroflexota bacterium]